MASARMQLMPLLKSANDLGFSTSILSIDIDNPDCINHLGSPNVCFIGKINHHDEARFSGFALSIWLVLLVLKHRQSPLG